MADLKARTEADGPKGNAGPRTGRGQPEARDAGAITQGMVPGIYVTPFGSRNRNGCLKARD